MTRSSKIPSCRFCPAVHRKPITRRRGARVASICPWILSLCTWPWPSVITGHDVALSCLGAQSGRAAHSARVCRPCLAYPMSPPRPWSPGPRGGSPEAGLDAAVSGPVSAALRLCKAHSARASCTGASVLRLRDSCARPVDSPRPPCGLAKLHTESPPPGATPSLASTGAGRSLLSPLL